VKARDILLAISVPLIWGLGLAFAKAAVDQFPPILLMALRFTVTALAMVWFVRPPWPLLPRICLIAVISATVQYSLTFTGLRGLDASTAALVIQLEVPFATLLAALFLREHLGLRRIGGMLLAFTGVVLIAGEPKLQQDLQPFFLVMGGAFTWALGQVMIRALGVVGGFTLISWVAVFAAPQLFIASWLFEADQAAAIASADWVVWGTVVYLGLVMTALGYGIWYHLLGRYEVGLVAPYLLLLPFVTVLAGVLLLGETLSLLVVAGGALIVAGVAIITLERRQPAAAAVD